jgi:hypothetical protein
MPFQLFAGWKFQIFYYFFTYFEFGLKMSAEIENWSSRRTYIFFRNVPGLPKPFCHVGIWDITRNETYEGHFLDRKDLFEPFIFHRTQGIEKHDIWFSLPIPVNLNALNKYALSRKPSPYGFSNNCQMNLLHANPFKGFLGFLLIYFILTFVSTTFAFLLGLFGLKCYLFNKHMDWIPFMAAFSFENVPNYQLYQCKRCQIYTSQVFIYDGDEVCSNCLPIIRNYGENGIINDKQFSFKKSVQMFFSQEKIIKDSDGKQQIITTYWNFNEAINNFCNYKLPMLWLADFKDHSDDRWTCHNIKCIEHCINTQLNKNRCIAGALWNGDENGKCHRCLLDPFLRDYEIKPEEVPLPELDDFDITNANNDLSNFQSLIEDYKVCNKCLKTKFFFHPKYFQRYLYTQNNYLRKDFIKQELFVCLKCDTSLDVIHPETNRKINMQELLVYLKKKKIELQDQNHILLQTRNETNKFQSLQGYLTQAAQLHEICSLNSTLSDDDLTHIALMTLYKQILTYDENLEEENKLTP